MGIGLYVDAGVRHKLDLLRAAFVQESQVLDALLIHGASVPEVVSVDHVTIGVALVPPAHFGSWTRLLVGRFGLSCELFDEDQLSELKNGGRSVDSRGVVVDPMEWRTTRPEGTSWEMWNARIRDLRQHSLRTATSKP